MAILPCRDSPGRSARAHRRNRSGCLNALASVAWLSRWLALVIGRGLFGYDGRSCKQINHRLRRVHCSAASSGGRCPGPWLAMLGVVRRRYGLGLSGAGSAWMSVAQTLLVRLYLRAGAQSIRRAVGIAVTAWTVSYISSARPHHCAANTSRSLPRSCRGSISRSRARSGFVTLLYDATGLSRGRPHPRLPPAIIAFRFGRAAPSERRWHSALLIRQGSTSKNRSRQEASHAYVGGSNLCRSRFGAASLARVAEQGSADPCLSLLPGDLLKIPTFDCRVVARFVFLLLRQGIIFVTLGPFDVRTWLGPAPGRSRRAS